MPEPAPEASPGLVKGVLRAASKLGLWRSTGPVGGDDAGEGPAGAKPASRGRRLAQTAAATFGIGLVALRSRPPLSYAKDPQQEYLVARAWLDGIDVFTPVTDLSRRYFPVAADNFPHPNPHPPILALLSVPLTALPFPAVVYLYLAVNVALLILVGRWLKLSLPASLALAAWPPVLWVLDIGQLEILVLALAMLGWRAASAGREWRAGIWLGVATALKFYPAFLLLPYVARRRLRVPLAAGLVFALSQVGDLLVVGPSGLVRYYRDVVPQVASFYARLGLNSSPYGAVLRLFGGAADVDPLVSAPGLVLPVAVALALVGLAAAVILLPAAAPTALLIALPSVWGYYAVLALPQIVSLLRRPDARRMAVPAVVAASLTLPLVVAALRLLGAVGSDGGRGPAIAGVLLALQPLGYVALLGISVVVALRTSGGVRAMVLGAAETE